MNITLITKNTSILRVKKSPLKFLLKFFIDFLKNFLSQRIKNLLKADKASMNFYYNKALPVFLRKNDKNITLTRFEGKMKVSHLKTLLFQRDDFDYLEKLEKLGVLRFSEGNVLLKLALNAENRKEIAEEDLEIIEI